MLILFEKKKKKKTTKTKQRYWFKPVTFSFAKAVWVLAFDIFVRQRKGIEARTPRHCKNMPVVSSPLKISVDSGMG